MQFSVLISIYNATRADDLDRCLTSLAEQTLPAHQVVLVRDGPVDGTVEACIEHHSRNLPIHHLRFLTNRGLGHALRDGLLACDHELVARVDSDDRSVPNRFALQIDYLSMNPSISVIGGWMKEYHQSIKGQAPVIRQTPLNHETLHRLSKRRNPINHPTVMFRKSHVLASGNYEPCLLFEDYFLWARMMTQGYFIANLPHVLVETEIDSNYFARRGGIPYVIKELHLLKKLRQIDFLSSIDMSIFILTRLPVRLLPLIVRRYLYRAFLRKA